MSSIEERLARIEVIIDKDYRNIQQEINIRQESTALALKLQATEVERRLSELNGEAGRLKAMQATYLTREKFEDFEQRMSIDMIEIAKVKGQLKSTIVFISALVSILTTLFIPFVQRILVK